MSRTAYKRRRKSREDRAREAAEALARIQSGDSLANLPTIYAGFLEKGIPESEIKPRENVLTYAAWQAKGRQVRRGERGVKVTTWIEYEKENPVTGEKEKGRAPRTATVFHISQTDPAGAPQPPREPKEGAAPRETEPRHAAPKEGAPPPREVADMLREKAASMEPLIESKFYPAIANQNPTRRRASIAASMRQDGYRLQEVQQGLCKIADAIETGTLPASLWHVRARSHVARILHGWQEEHAEARQWLRDRIEGKSAEQEAQEAEAEFLRQLIGRKIPGFFPTPAELAARMVELANIKPEHEVLEPSAGKGDIADAIKAQHAGTLQLIEINAELCELLRTKGYEPYNVDFLDCEGECDRIVMNPPYENGQDAQHVRHAYDLLRPGGRIVALMSEGPFFRQDRKAQEFRKWLESGPEILHDEQIRDAFKGPQAFRQTGVAVRLLVIDKPAD